MPITVAIVEDNLNLRMGTSYILSSSPKFKVVGEYETAEELVEEFQNINPEVILMDIGLPGMSGIEATTQIKSNYPWAQIVILSVFEDNENIFQAICAGACGYISKPVLPNQLHEAVEQAFNGASPMSPNIARKVLDLFKEHIPPPKADYNLTEREFEVLNLLTKGDDHKMIAEKLYLSPFTVRAHLRNIYEKLHVHSKSQAVVKALQERLLPTKTK